MNIKTKISSLENRLQKLGKSGSSAPNQQEEMRLALDIIARLQASLNDSNFSLLLLRMLEDRYPGIYQRIDSTVRADILDASGVFVDLLEEVITEETGGDLYEGLTAVPKNPILS